MARHKLAPGVEAELESLGNADRQASQFIFAEIARVGVACSRVNACLRLINSLMTRSMSMCATVHGLAGGDDTAIKARAAKLHESFPELRLTFKEVGSAS